MFLGSVPTKCIEQLLRVIPFGEWNDIYVCCSGSFRIEQALRSRYPDIGIYSNDVSLYSTAIGRLAINEPFSMTFQGRLEFVEPLLEGKPFLDRAAAVIVAHEMSRFIRNNEYARKHFAYYVESFPVFLDRAKEKLASSLEGISIQGYNGCDWRSHVDEAISHGAGIAAFPPFFKADYEKQYKFLEDSILWQAPSYDIYDPKMLDEILTKIENSGVPYCLLSDQVWEHRPPMLEYIQGRKKPHYCYARTNRSTVRHLFNKPVPFKYKPIDPNKLTPKSQVQIIPAETGHLNFIKDVYLAKSIVHTSGLMGFFVYIDGMLVGGIIYALQKHGIATYSQGECIYLLSDVTISNEMKLSKLVALIATSQTLTRMVEKKIVSRIRVVVTTARTHKPVSMKYRGIYKLLTRRPSEDPTEGNIIQYGSEVRLQTPQQLYRDWFKKYATLRQNSGQAA